MRKLNIKISHSEKNFGLEINIWQFSAYSWSRHAFVHTLILFANLYRLCLSVVLSSKGTRGHTVKGSSPPAPLPHTPFRGVVSQLVSL